MACLVLEHTQDLCLLSHKLKQGVYANNKCLVYKNTNAIVLAIPRGGLEIGYSISKELGLPLDVILTKKIGHPYQEEYALGAVSLTDIIITDNSIPKEYIEKESKKIKKLLAKRYKDYRGNKKPIDIKEKIVIIVDDGAATGSTISVAVDFVKKEKAKKVIVAIPVAHPDAILKIKNKADEVVCLHVTESFFAVGQFYQNFNQVEDEEAIKLLKEANS